MEPELKQVVVEEWGAIDRCTTCHMAIEDPRLRTPSSP